MYSDLMIRREQLWRQRNTPKWQDALKKLAPCTRALIQQFMQPGSTLAGTTYPWFGHTEAKETEPDFLLDALGDVLMRGAMDLFSRLLHQPGSEVGGAYEEYFREDFPHACEEIPATLSERFYQAVQRGEQTLVAVVTQEAASFLGLSQPSPQLTAETSRHLGPFKLLAHDIGRLRCESTLALAVPPRSAR